MAKKIFFALFDLLLVIVVGTFVPTAYADCGQPAVHIDGKDCPLFNVQLTVQDEKGQPVHGVLVQLNLTNGDSQYGITDRAGIYVFEIPEIRGVESVALVEGQNYKGWTQFQVWGSNCDWFNVTLVAYPVEEALNKATPVLTSPQANVSNMISDSVVISNSTGISGIMNDSPNGWLNNGIITYDYSTDVTNTVNVSVTFVTVEQSAPVRKELKKQDPRPVSPPPAKPSMTRDDSDQHSRHNPVLETHPWIGQVTFEDFVVLLLWSVYAWVMSHWVHIAVIMALMGAWVAYAILRR